jgi:hypothetical protein
MLFQMGRCPLGIRCQVEQGIERPIRLRPFDLEIVERALEGVSPATIRTEVPCELENDEALEAARRPFDPRIMPLPGSFASTTGRAGRPEQDQKP